MTKYGFIKREVLLCILFCLTVTLIEAVNKKEFKKMNRKIETLIGGLQDQLITAVLEIEELRNSTPACECEHQTTTEHVGSQLGMTNLNEKTESDTQTIETLVEIIFNGFMDEKYARKQLEHQIETRIEETIKSQNNENNRLQKVLTDIYETNAVQHTEIQRLDALNQEVNIKYEKIMSALEEISNSSKSDRDEINCLIELMLDMNNTVITQHDEFERLNKEVIMFKTNAKPKYEEIDSLNKTLRAMTNTIDWMTTYIPICTKPASINNGNIEYSGTVMGSVATYTCNEGYNLQGVNEIKCLQNKQLEGTAPVCTPEQCFLHVNNESKYWFQTNDSIGLITENKYIDHGMDFLIECRDGYILTNAQDETAATRQTTHCYFGTWKNAYNCRPKKCPLPVFNNGTIKTETGSLANGDATDSTKITFECKDDFKLLNSEDSVIQSLETTCRLGNWSLEIPSCHPICTIPESINNGNVNYSGTVMGSVATYTCNEGYILQGVNERKCLQNKQWKGTVPVCTPEKCFLHVNNDSKYWFQTDDSIGRITKNRYIYHGMDVIIECRDGYILTNADNQTATTRQITHCNFGTWKNVYNCRPKKCPIPVFNNGIIKTETGSLANGDATDSTTVTFECKDGFELLNSEDSVIQIPEATCRLGNWSLEIPKCHPRYGLSGDARIYNASELLEMVKDGSIGFPDPQLFPNKTVDMPLFLMASV